ncbi:hypothetical protein HOG48_00340 [Candidatus Peregrinibacteria bacterium]|nr:hypothetical protein [Candidatus Peregrinibacteria bacterium]
METTKLTYLENQNLYKSEAKITDTQSTEDNRIAIILDQTIFYPQGGGQPYDQGTISLDSTLFEVQEVRFKDGIVYHIGEYLEGQFNIGNTVQCEVNKERRALNSRLHSAGHLIGHIMQKLAPQFNPTKGHHFPGECYVAYEGKIPEEEREPFKQKIENAVNEAISQDVPIEIRSADYNELRELCDMIPLYVPKDKPCRIMSILFSDGAKTMPCGGTHVASMGELKNIHIKKCSSKKGVIKLSYECEI